MLRSSPGPPAYGLLPAPAFIRRIRRITDSRCLPRCETTLVSGSSTNMGMLTSSGKRDLEHARAPPAGAPPIASCGRPVEWLRHPRESHSLGVEHEAMFWPLRRNVPPSVNTIPIFIQGTITCLLACTRVTPLRRRGSASACMDVCHTLCRSSRCLQVTRTFDLDIIRSLAHGASSP